MAVKVRVSSLMGQPVTPWARLGILTPALPPKAVLEAGQHCHQPQTRPGVAGMPLPGRAGVRE